MENRTLRHTDIKVSPLCLGTMTFGEQNSLKESHQIMDYALDNGINFFDTAEMYPIPPKEETHFKTEQYIGKWDKFQSSRDKVILATKIIGPSSSMTYIRNGSPIIKDSLKEAIQGSLKRLNTDYIDLYQIHWPARVTNYFGQLGYSYPEELQADQISETVHLLEELKKEGLIRAYGVSNESPWGMMKYQEVSKIAEKTHRILNCKGVTRSDFKFLNDKFYLLEINTQPGMTELSLVPEIAQYKNISFEKLINSLIQDASINR